QWEAVGRHHFGGRPPEAAFSRLLLGDEQKAWWTLIAMAPVRPTEEVEDGPELLAVIGHAGFARIEFEEEAGPLPADAQNEITVRSKAFPLQSRLRGPPCNDIHACVARQQRHSLIGLPGVRELQPQVAAWADVLLGSAAGEAKLRRGGFQRQARLHGRELQSRRTQLVRSAAAMAPLDDQGETHCDEAPQHAVDTPHRPGQE